MHQQSFRTLPYMVEVDGLRAVAVVLVLLAHTHLAGATGGFIGVDVFFVISGFLITSVIIKGVEGNNFNFWQFYGRRLVRLYPALLAMVLLTFIVCLLISDPQSLMDMTRTGRYVLFSVSNIFFTQNMGYFDTVAQKQVFLHTWTLGVEWQFYLLTPLLIWACVRLLRFKRKGIFITLALVTLTSLIASQWALNASPQAAYYLMPYRAFELGIGALLVFVYHKTPNPLTSVLMVIAGITSIIISAFAYNPSTPFPGIAALVPCLGAAMCIWGGKAFHTGNFLRHPAVVYTGKISYSVYLVHWPMIVLTRYYLYRELLLSERIMLLIASLFLGAIFYELIEKRMTWGKLKNKLLGSLVLITTTFALLTTFYYAGKKSFGMYTRLGEMQLNNHDYYKGGRSGFHDIDMIGDVNGQKLAIIAGDSFSHAYSTGFDESLRPRQRFVNLQSSPGCLISRQYYRFDFPLVDFQYKKGCFNASSNALQLSAEQNLPLVIIQSWASYKHFTFAHYDDVQATHPISSETEYDAFLAENLDDLLITMGVDH